jgi:hypothetical protein
MLKPIRPCNTYRRARWDSGRGIARGDEVSEGTLAPTRLVLPSVPPGVQGLGCETESNYATATLLLRSLKGVS